MTCMNEQRINKDRLLLQVLCLSCLLLGARKLSLTPPLFSLVLAGLSLTALVKLLTWILVFVFRRSLIAEEENRRQEGEMNKRPGPGPC